MPPKRSNLGRHHYETQRKRVIRPDNVINNNAIIWHRAAFAYDRLKIILLMLKFRLVKCQKFANIAMLKGGLLRHLECAALGVK